MRVVRRGDIDGVDVRIGVEVLDRLVHLLDAILLGKSLGFGKRTVGDTRELAAGQREGLGHLVGDNTAPDHCPTKLGSRKDVVWERLILDRGKRRLCGCLGVERSLFGICMMCLLSHRKSFISNNPIVAQLRAYLLVFAYLFAYRSLFSHSWQMFAQLCALSRKTMRMNAHATILVKHKEAEHQSPKEQSRP